MTATHSQRTPRLPPSGEHPGTGEPGVVRDAPIGEEAVVNLGQDTRNLVLVRKARGAKRSDEGGAAARQRRTRRQTRTGRYELFCSLPGHRNAGMRAALVVRR